MRHATFPIHALSLALFSLCSAVAAQTQPDAGQIQRDLLPRPTHPAAVALPLAVQEPAAPAVVVGGAAFSVSSVLIQGHSVFPTEELLALVAHLVGPARTLADAQAGAQRITAHYRARGYPVARAHVPAQDITAGQLRIQVLEGRVEHVHLHNTSRVGSAVVSSAMHGLQAGDVIASAPVDRALLVLGDMPGVAAARATLQPGGQVGTSRLGVDLDPAPMAQGSTVLDNHGSAYTGRTRASGLLQLNSPLGLGDRLGLTGLTSGPGLRHARIAYDLALGGAGTRGGVVHHQTRYRLGGEFVALQASGVARDTELFVSHPVWLTPTGRLVVTLSTAQQTLHDRIDTTASSTDKTVRATSLSLDGRWRDGQGDRLTSARLGLVNGQLRIHSLAAAAQDAAAAGTQGRFARAVWSVEHAHRVVPAAQVFVSYGGQRANRNLDSAEKFAIGGPRAVRAYGSGEASGDEADLLTVEWRQRLTPALQAVVFHDAGRVRLNHTPFDPGASNRRTLSGAGLGLTAEAMVAGTAVSLQSSLAWPLQGRPAQGASVGRPAWWLTLAVRF